MGSPINLEKIKRVHQEMLARQALFAADKERCDWAHDVSPDRSSGFLNSFDDTFDRLAFNIHPSSTDAQRVGSSHPPIPMRASGDANRCKCGVRRTKDRSLETLAREHCISRQLLVNRLIRGIPLEEALKIPRESQTPLRAASLTTMLVFRESTMTLRDWARQFGLSPYTVRTRLHAGWQVEAALTTPSKPVGRGAKAKGGCLSTLIDAAGTGGVGSRDTEPKPAFFEGDA